MPVVTNLDHHQPFPWLANILWPDHAADIGPHGTSRPRWWASPSAADPRILIPADAPAAARTAVRRYHDGFDTRRRLRSLAAETVLRVPPLARAVLDRNRVAVAHPGHDLQGVIDGIAEVMGIDDLEVAIGLSVPKSNRKPVLQLLDRSGRCHGWAKVAWNDRVDRLVGNEAAWLGVDAVAPVTKPDLLHDVDIEGRRVVIATGATPSRLPRRHRHRPPAPEVFVAVSAMGTPAALSIKESPWWRSVEAVVDHATPRERLAMQTAIEGCYRHRFRVGAWHGDLTPWNLMSVGGRPHLIDWEFAADGVPLGFDVCHFHTQVAAEQRGLDAAAAIDFSARLSPHGLARIGVQPENRTAVWRLYLVELVRRQVALRAAGHPEDDVTFGPAALHRLERSQGTSNSTVRSGS